MIHPDFKCGKDFTVGNCCVIESDVKVGDNVTLGHNVILKSGTRFGNNVIFADYCCTTGYCILGDRVNVRTRSTISKAVIVEDCVFIGGAVMTSHTKHVPHCRSKIADIQYRTRIGYSCVIGSRAILLAGVWIAPNSIIGAGSVVVKNIERPGVYVGNPSKRCGGTPVEYFMLGKSQQYDFDRKMLERYLPNLVFASPNKNISKEV